MLNTIQNELTAFLEDPDAANVRVVLAIFCKCHVDDMKKPLVSLSRRWFDFAGSHMGWYYAGSNATRLSKSNPDALSRIEHEIESADGGSMLSFNWQGPDAFAPDHRL
ncbi:MAG: hypothetical protein AB8I08_32675 [Sandaracinaceae bacterium]